MTKKFYKRLQLKKIRVMNMLFSVCILYINCVIYKYGTKMLLKIMKETQSTFAARMDRKFSWNSSFVSLIFLLLVLKTSQARILVPEQQGKLLLLHHLQTIHVRPQSNGPSYVKCAGILCFVRRSVREIKCVGMSYYTACTFYLRN